VRGDGLSPPSRRRVGFAACCCLLCSLLRFSFCWSPPLLLVRGLVASADSGRVCGAGGHVFAGIGMQRRAGLEKAAKWSGFLWVRPFSVELRPGVNALVRWWGTSIASV
jgi:hypothetical protein